tara:strand:+ start:147 stop:632 length:486 start_codon:yes stop_codon:yes gene_type:complete
MNKNNGISITEYNDNRITHFGKFLRAYKIDELTQLFNILKGDMRFIGPRPESSPYFNEHDFSFLRKIKPGLSDYASIILRNESKILFKIGGEDPYKKLLPMKLELAKYYARNKSFFLDLKLVFITIISILNSSYPLKKFIIPMLEKDLPDVKSFCESYVFE